jgi:hypothetical protein
MARLSAAVSPLRRPSDRRRRWNRLSFLSDLIGRCRELKLRAVGSERRLKQDFAVLLTVKTMHFLYNQGRRTWLSL